MGHARVCGSNYGWTTQAREVFVQQRGALRVRSAASRLGSTARSHRLHGGDHVDHRMGSCAFSCDVGCLYHRALGSQACGRTGIGHSATTSHLHDPIPALRAKPPHRRPRAAQEIFSPRKGRWARARIALSQPNRHGRREAAERRGNERLASTRDCVSHRSGAYYPRDHRWATRLV